MITLSKSTRGSSFIELLVAISLGLIFLGGATLSMTIFLHPETEKQTAQEITTFLEQASLNALRSQKPVAITLERNQLSESLKGRGIALPKDYLYTSKFGGSQNLITFYPSGFASAGTIAIHGDGTFCIISQTISGARRTECSDVY